MQTADIWNKLHLYGSKIILVVIVMMFAGQVCHAQRKMTWVKKNNPNYDQRKITYGFLIGLHTSAYQLKYSDKFVTPEFDTVLSVQPEWKPGFTLGFIVNYRAAEYLDIRLTPQVTFYENKVTYFFTDDTKKNEQLVETTMVEFPVLLKYKSERRGNVRMYMIGGIKPGIEASGKKDKADDVLEVKSANLSLDVGFGFDFYYPLFKFSPEIRFSRGVGNILANTNNDFGQPLKYINTNTITVYLLFQ